MNSSMSKQQGAKVTDVFRASRTGAAPTRGGKARGPQAAAPPAPAAAQAEPQLPQDQQQAEADEAALRQFDLDTRFGPCTGITRLQRYERAVRLGLDPPPEVAQLVARHGADSQFNANVFAPNKGP